MGGVADGGVELRVHADGVVERRAWGFVTVARSAQADVEFEALAARIGVPLRVVADTRELTGLEPGAAGASVRAVMRQRPTIACLAVVARQPTLIALSHTLAVLVPDLPLRICADRREAFAFVARTPAGADASRARADATPPRGPRGPRVGSRGPG